MTSIPPKNVKYNRHAILVMKHQVHHTHEKLFCSTKLTTRIKLGYDAEMGNYFLKFIHKFINIFLRITKKSQNNIQISYDIDMK